MVSLRLHLTSVGAEPVLGSSPSNRVQEMLWGWRGTWRQQEGGLRRQWQGRCRNQSALHLGLASLERWQFRSWAIWSQGVVEMNAFHVVPCAVLQNMLETLHGPPVPLLKCKFPYFSGSSLLQAPLCRLSPPLPTDRGSPARPQNA